MIKGTPVDLCVSPSTPRWPSSRTGLPTLFRDLAGTGVPFQRAAENFSSWENTEISATYSIMHSEHRILVKGCAERTKGVNVISPAKGKSTHTPIGEMHRLAYPWAIPFDTIEMQSVTRRREHDIVRTTERYARY